MADNVVANAGSGGATFATDEVSSVHYPINKLAYGALDSVTLVSTSNGLPIQVIGTPAVTAVVTNAGTFAVQGGGERAEDAAHSSGHTGVFVLAVRSDTPANTAGTDGDYCALITDSTGRLHCNVSNLLTVASHAVTNAGTFAVQDGPSTSGGLSSSKTISAATTNATSVKASAGQVYSIACSSINAAARYLKLYNKASAPTVGTDTPVMTLVIPGNTAGAGFVFNIDKGLAFATGIAFALTSGIADADTGAVSASEHTVNILYK